MRGSTRARERRSTVTITGDDEHLDFCVADTGAGFDPRRAAEGHGFVNMRDRLGAVGGTLDRRERRRARGPGSSGHIPLDPAAIDAARASTTRSSSAPDPTVSSPRSRSRAAAGTCSSWKRPDRAGGGTRSEELTLPGVRPRRLLGDPSRSRLASPALRDLPLGEHGLEWVHPGRSARASARRRSRRGAAPIGRGDRGRTRRRRATPYRRLFGPFVRQDLVDALLDPLSFPRAPIPLARFGPVGIRSAAGLARAPVRDRRGACAVRAASPRTRCCRCARRRPRATG